MNSQESKRRILARRVTLFVLLLISINSALSQYPNETFVEGGIYSLDVPVDARGNAMGESFVALSNNSLATMYNPAGLIGLEGVHVRYARRGFRDHGGLVDIDYQMITAAFHSSLFDVGITYGRFDRAGYDFSFSSGSTRGTTHIDVYDHTLALSIARKVADDFSLGVGIKTFDVSRKANASWYSLKTTPPVLFDVGAIFSYGGMFTNGQIHDSFTMGASLQNFGTDFRGKETIATDVDEGIMKLPRYIRAGLSYTLALNEPDKSSSVFSLLVTAEYRNLLNAGGWLGDNKDFWGFGVETSFLELFSARLGGYIQPFKSLLGSRGTPALRYGFGLSVPFALMGIDTPLEVRLEYAGMPTQNYAEFVDQTNKTWDIEIVYALNM